MLFIREAMSGPKGLIDELIYSPSQTYSRTLDQEYKIFCIVRKNRIISTLKAYGIASIVSVYHKSNMQLPSYIY